MATLLIVDDEPDIVSAYAVYFERQGHRVVRAFSGEEGVEAYRRHRPDLVLLDLRLPDISGMEVLARLQDLQPVVIMITGYGDVPMAVEAMQRGAENFLTKPVELSHLSAAVERGLEKARLRQLTGFLRERREQGRAASLLGTSPAMRELAEQIELLAQSERTTVLLLGESGTGKGRVAETIHALSPRATRAFVEVNCASLGAPALDQELFGAGANAGANGGAEAASASRRALVELAEGGTLFLDEIAELPALLQPKLLRLLEGKPVRRASGTDEVRAELRLVAATNKDLVSEVNAERFREDLYYRLSVMPLSLPPLRARSREDLVQLIAHLFDELRPQLPDAPARVSDLALDRLLRYSWPGNLRELRNVLERAMIVGRGAAEVGVAHLAPEVREASGAHVEHYVARSLEEVERIHIERTLHAHEGNRTRAAKELGISRATLIKKIKEYGLDVRRLP